MTSLALLLANFYVLRMIKINMIGKAVDTNPFNRSSWPVIFFSIGVPSGVVIYFLNFSCSIHRCSIFTYNGIACIFFDGHMAVHTNIYTWNISVLAVLCSSMTIQTADLVSSCVNFMRIIDRLYGLISLHPT